jgi:hypothetical protein
VRWGAVIALARADGRQAGQAVVDELLVWAGGSVTGAVPFLDGDLAEYARLALRQVGERHPDE